MKKVLFLLVPALLFLGCENNKGAFVHTVQSKYSTKKGVEIFEKILEEQGLSIFQVIDHAQNAKNSGMELLPNTLVVFGNPKMGTVLMQCNPTMGLDLPLKMLFTTDYEGNNWVSYTNPEYYSLKHNIKDKNCLEIIKKANIALQTLSGELAETNTTAQPQTTDASAEANTSAETNISTQTQTKDEE